MPFAREVLRPRSQVVLAANDLPSINDVTCSELVEIISKKQTASYIDEFTVSVHVA
ncbi:hypothetical protein JHK87_045128 [Glycine soja]|nr:hypothetical protein JHK87_045128 [Glycine soja]